ncbi:MAG: hypothetical protein AB4050_01805 [Synechococcus sp.]
MKATTRKESDRLRLHYLTEEICSEALVRRQEATAALLTLQTEGVLLKLSDTQRQQLADGLGGTMALDDAVTILEDLVGK